MRTSFQIDPKALPRVLVIALAISMAGCSTGTEPLSAETIAGEYDLTLANGFLVPHEPFLSGTLEVKADSTYTLFLNGALSQSGTWSVKGKNFTATATSGACAPFFALTPKTMPEWCIWPGYLETQAIRLLLDKTHSNWYVFHARN